MTLTTPTHVHGIDLDRHNRIVLKALESVFEDATHLLMEGPLDLMELAQDRVLERELLISQHRDRRSKDAG